MNGRIASEISNSIHGLWRRIVLMLIDFAIFAVIDIGYYYASSHLYFGTVFNTFNDFLLNSLILLAVTYNFRLIFKIYSNVWRYTNTAAYLKLVAADTISCVISIVIMRLINEYNGVWHSLIVYGFTLLAVLVSRFVYRTIYKLLNLQDRRTSTDRTFVNVAIVGAGQLGVYLVNELNDNFELGYKPRCFIDSDNSKCGGYIAGLKIENQSNTKRVVERYSIGEFIIAINNIDNDALTGLYNFYKSFGCGVKIYASPLSADSEEESSAKRKVRDFSIEDLLFRNQVDLIDRKTREFYTGKTVLITGGGGSIGSEICRQVARCNPKKLIIFDIYENNAYDIQQELRLKYKQEFDLNVEIGSVRDVDRLKDVFEHYRPEIVFHAAAHKHVPLMEHSACEAIKNNVFGTYNTVNIAEQVGVKKFILVSTDKAVNPTNIMGASKRLCEMIVQSHSDSDTCFAAVRFGNVLGSNGSVIPLFKRQIESGGPVTITDKRVIRYFMTIPEASQLVMTAGQMAKKKELFVLDMGKPIKIYDLCVNMIKTMGYIPDSEIEIKEIGLRPGEKLYEELLIKTEKLGKTENKKIFIEEESPMDVHEIADKLDILKDALEKSAGSLDMTLIREAMHRVVPTFKEADEVNRKASESEEMKLAGTH